MSFSTVTVVLNQSMQTGNTSPVSLTYTFPNAPIDGATAQNIVQSMVKGGAIFTDSRHLIPTTAIQYLDIS